MASIIPVTPYPHLEYFFNTYFHQNWIDGYDWKGGKPAFEVVVKDFKDKTSQARVDQVIQDLETIIKQNLNESELRHMVYKRLRANIYPPGLDMTYQAWLEAVLAILRENE